MAPWPIQSPNVLTAHGVDLDHSIIRVAIPPGNRDKDTWSTPGRQHAIRAGDRSAGGKTIGLFVRLLPRLRLMAHCQPRLLVCRVCNRQVPRVKPYKTRGRHQSTGRPYIAVKRGRSPASHLDWLPNQVRQAAYRERMDRRAPSHRRDVPVIVLATGLAHMLVAIGRTAGCCSLIKNRLRRSESA
jgi:hypothetical protein